MDVGHLKLSAIDYQDQWYFVMEVDAIHWLTADMHPLFPISIFSIQMTVGLITMGWGLGFCLCKVPRENSYYKIVKM